MVQIMYVQNMYVQNTLKQLKPAFSGDKNGKIDFGG